MAAIPCYKGFLAADTSASLKNLFLYAQHATPRIEWIRMVSTGCPVLPRVRNSMVAKMFAEGCDGILFIDDDIGFNPEDVYRMLGHGFGLVGAVPQKRNARWNDPPILAISPQRLRVNKDLGLATPEEPRLPMALTFISAQCFRDIAEANLAPQIMYPVVGEESQKHMRMYFGYELTPCPDWSAEAQMAAKLGIENPHSEDGEDHYFCRRAAQVGYEPIIDLEVELRHWEGQVKHDYSFKKFFAENPEVLRPVPADDAHQTLAEEAA